MPAKSAPEQGTSGGETPMDTRTRAARGSAATSAVRSVSKVTVASTIGSPLASQLSQQQLLFSSQLSTGSAVGTASTAAANKKALLAEQREAAEALRQEQRGYSIGHAPAHAMTPWNRVFIEGLQRRHNFFAVDVKHAANRGKKMAKELKRFVEDVEKKEIQLQEQQERECTRIGAALGKAVAKRWHTMGNAYTRQVRVEFELVKQRKAQKKQEELLKETEDLTSQLITWVLARKQAAQDRNKAIAAKSQQEDCDNAATSGAASSAAADSGGGGVQKESEVDDGSALPDLEKALSAGQELFDETKSLALFNSLNGTRPLREYQRTALQWMINLYTNDLNGILADEMGLGKTVQTIALLCYFAQYKQDWGPHLIVVPTTVVLNWQTELMRWAPGLKVITYIGSRDQRVELRKGWTKQGAFDVCVTSYNVFMRDQDAFRRLYWGFLVLDEAHQIKNFASQKWQSLYELKTSYRLLLTGTPLQNNVMELWSLFHFLMPSATAFASHEEFESWYSNPMNDMVSGKASLNEELVRRLQALIRPFLLRRLKKDVETQLPSKTTKIIKCSLSPRQRMLYDEFLNLRNTKQAIRSGGHQGVLSVILSLRKVCNHPDLFEPRPIVSPFVMARHEPIVYTVPSDVLLLGNDDRWSMDTEEGGYRPAALRCPIRSGPSSTLLLNLSPARGLLCSGLFPKSLLLSPLVGANNASTSGGCCAAMSDAQRRRLLEVVVLNQCGPQRKVAVEAPAPAPSSSSLPAWARQIFSPTYAGANGNGTKAVVDVSARTKAADRTLAAADYLWSLPVETLRRKVQPFLAQNILCGGGAADTTAVGDGVGRIASHAAVERMLTSWTVGRTVRCGVLGSPAPPCASTSTQKKEKEKEKKAVLLSRPSYSDRSAVKLVCLVQDVSMLTYHNSPIIGKLAIVVPKALAQTNAMVAGGSWYGGTAPQLVANGKLLSHWRPFRQSREEDGARFMCALMAASGNGSSSSSSSLAHTLASSRRMHLVSELAWVSHNRHLREISGGSTDRRRRVAAAQAKAGINPATLAKKKVTSAAAEGIIRMPFPQSNDLSVYAPPLTGSYVVGRDVASTASLAAPLWQATTARALNFPDKHTLIHDSGKLQTLATLLPKLRAEGHRCLIFSQFTVMLDILQKFLAMRGFPCLRIDGATGAVERQDYVERFNRDERIPCMILSTRSGGIGLNLVGADTVIFYDSDWNPTIDLQAQDRCHRIGQTRSVTIYRLICDRTIEEQILEKARERERLNSVVIRSGAFHITAWDHHEKATEEIKKQMEAKGGDAEGVAAAASAAATSVVSSGATSALFTRQDLRSFFKNVNDDIVEGEEDEDAAGGGGADDSAAVEAAMDMVEDDADRTARRAAAKEIKETELADQQDLTTMTDDASSGAANGGGGQQEDAEMIGGAANAATADGLGSQSGGGLLSQQQQLRSSQRLGVSSLFTHEESLSIRRQRQQLLMRLPNVVDRSIVSGFAKVHPAKARLTMKALADEYRDEVGSSTADALAACV